MKISTKGRYGLRAMVDLAVNSGGMHIPLNAIAERQNVSVNYMEQVFSALRKAGLVNSIKGSQGGYVLAELPSDITISNILNVLEGDMTIARNSDISAGSSLDAFLEHKLWKRIDECIQSVTENITLGDLVDEYTKINGGSLMYYI